LIENNLKIYVDKQKNRNFLLGKIYPVHEFGVELLNANCGYVAGL
jgi:hypothetical protein